MEDFAGTDAERKEKASGPILRALKKSRDAFEEWDATCHFIDSVYSRHGASYEGLMASAGGADWKDAEMDLFWSSFEIMKPAIYARPPVPAVSPMFKDGGRLKDTTAEILERAATSTFNATGVNNVLEGVRDDMIFAGRGVPWLRYEDDDGKRVCVEHLEREDFLHDVARKWSEVGWVAAGFWMTKDEIEDRFDSLTAEQLDEITYHENRDTKRRDESDMTAKAKVWEVWHRANDRVYWVVDDLDVYLDEGKPHLKLTDFFPCPRPAYSTLRRRSLIPVPDYERYSSHFAKINRLTSRIYLLLDQVKMKGLIPGGGDVASAIEQVLRSVDDQIVIQVPGAAMMEGGNFVVWLPLQELAQAITGLIEARRQLIEDFYQLSGISDIMRGATEADETLGAQQMKAQYGSVRVQCKINEIQRVSADMVKIVSEIIAEKFDGETLLEAAQMELPTRKDIKDRIKEIESAGEKELEALEEVDVDPQQVEAMFKEQQQAILDKYGPMLEEAEALVPIDDVIDLLRDDRARSFAFDIETDSTVLIDELSEKQARNEFIGAFNNATQGLTSIAAMGEEGAILAGEMMKFVLAPYRVGRQMAGAIDDFVKAAPAMLSQQPEGDGGMGELAEAEKMKAQAAMERVNAMREKDAAENERKFAELQAKAAKDQREYEAKMAKLQQDAENNGVKAQEAMAKVDKIRAETIKLLRDSDVKINEAALNEFESLEKLDIAKAQEQRSAVKDQREAARSDRNEVREASQPVVKGPIQ